MIDQLFKEKFKLLYYQIHDLKHQSVTLYPRQKKVARHHNGLMSQVSRLTRNSRNLKLRHNITSRDSFVKIPEPSATHHTRNGFLSCPVTFCLCCTEASSDVRFPLFRNQNWNRNLTKAYGISFLKYYL